jgi:translation elongation factor EF-Tu-like GTPase
MLLNVAAESGGRYREGGRTVASGQVTDILE